MRACAFSDPLNASGGRNTVGRRQQRPRVIAAQQLETRFGVLPKTLDGVSDVADQRDNGILRQIVGERSRLVEEERQVVLDAARHHTVAHVLVKRRAQRIAFEHLAIPAAETRAAGFVDREFARGEEPHFGDGIERALRIGVEGLDALDVVAEQIESIRQRTAHREEIDEPAAHAEFARRDDLGHVLVTGESELRAQRIDVETRAVLQEERERSEIVGRCQAVERRRRRDHQHVAFAARHMVERREALRDEILVRREVVVGKGFPIRQQHDPPTGREPGHLVGNALSRQRVGADNDEQALFRGADFRKLRERQGVGGADERGAANLVPGSGQTRDERGQRRERRSDRGGGGGRGRGGGAARCGDDVGRRRGCRRRLPVGGDGRWHVQLRIDRGLYADTRAIIGACRSPFQRCAVQTPICC